ncbi:MAG: PIG-L deacetylase family protein [Chloroflexota bacterium]|nr:PIG-L deacetylase family protein [Chloroflexota bacterium]
MIFTEGWETLKGILVILAHPDDPEFFFGGTIARWVKAGHSVRYVLLTKGDKGAGEDIESPEEVIKIRVKEQDNAARFLGVKSVAYLDYHDGYLIPDLEMRKKVVRAIRKYQPDILVTCDPTNYFPSQQYINHPDHRNAGQVVIDAVFPAVGNRFFFPELHEEGFFPHEVEEVWMSLTNTPDVTLDVTENWHDRIEALKMHASQIGDPDAFEKRMLERVQKDDTNPFRYEENFRVIKFRRTN